VFEYLEYSVATWGTDDILSMADRMHSYSINALNFKIPDCQNKQLGGMVYLCFLACPGRFMWLVYMSNYIQFLGCSFGPDAFLCRFGTSH